MILWAHPYSISNTTAVSLIQTLSCSRSLFSVVPSHTNMLYKFKAQLLHLQFSADFALSADQWSLVAHLIPLPQSFFLCLSCFPTSHLFQHIVSQWRFFCIFLHLLSVYMCWLSSVWGQMLMVVISSVVPLKRLHPQTSAPHEKEGARWLMNL